MIIESSSIQNHNRNHDLVQVRDFAGQEVYYAAHRLFLTRNCKVLLAFEGIRLLKDSKHKYEAMQRTCWWLRAIRERTQGTAGVYLVLTKRDKMSVLECERVKQEVSSALKTAFRVQDLSELIVDGNIFCVSALEGLHGVAELRRHLCLHLAADPHSHVGVPLPSVYLRLVETAHMLEHRVVMRWEELKLLASQQLGLRSDSVGDDTNFDRALEFVHENGTAMWFAEHGRLREWVFLQPKFLTDLLACIQRQQHESRRVNLGPERSMRQIASRKLTKTGILQLDFLRDFWERLNEPEEGGVYV